MMKEEHPEMSEIQKQQTSSKQEEKELGELILKVWSNRIFILKVCAIAFLVGLVVALSIPKEYTTTVTIAPESSVKTGSGNLGMLASMAGINIPGSTAEDALSPELYPNIVNSTPFLLDLFSVQIVNQNDKKTYSLYDYMDNYQHEPWWNVILSAPLKALDAVFSLFSETAKESVIEKKPDGFHISRDQSRILMAISERIAVSVDKKSGVITLGVRMQDPLVSAALTDTVMKNLQIYITEYRTNKAKKDLEYTEKLYEEARKEYYSAQQKYADFADTNLDIIRSGYRTRQERLQNEATLAYSLYNQISQQRQLAKAKVQEVTPVYTVIQPASVPLRPSEPNKPVVLFLFVFLSFLGSISWIFYIKDFMKTLKKQHPFSLDEKINNGNLSK